MKVPVVALSARMTRWAIGGRRYHHLVWFSASLWAATTGRSASAVCNRVATLVRMPVRPMWSCGAGLGGVGRLTSVQRRNQTRVRLSVWRESGSAMISGDLNATSWRKAKTSSQLSAMVVKVSAVAWFALPGFTVFLSSNYMVTTLSSLLSSSALLAFSPSFAHSVMDQAKIFRSSPAFDSPWRITASVINGGRRTALRSVHSPCLFERARLPAAARRRTSAIGRRIFLPYILREIIEGEIRSPARMKSTMDYPRDLFPTAVWTNINWTFPSVALFVNIVRLGKSLKTLLYFLEDGSLVRMTSWI